LKTEFAITSKAIQDTLERGNFISPDYQSRSTLNIPASAAYLLNVPGFKHNPVDQKLLNPIRDGVKNIILVLMDALAF